MVPRQMPEYTKVGLKITRLLTQGREPLPTYRDCFNSGMNPIFSTKATNFKTKDQEDKKLNKDKKIKNGSSREKEMPKVVSRLIGTQMGYFNNIT
eukprot:scaffold102962_cov52-Attheya_sp.AAC.1